MAPDMDETEIATMILKLKLVQSNLKQIYKKKEKIQKKLDHRKEKKRHRKEKHPSDLRKPERDDASQIGSRMGGRSAAGQYEDDDVSALGG